jgi:hypothetical protein
MDLFFLSARVPLTKAFTRAANGEIEKSPYPLIKKFTSHKELVTTTDEFFAAVQDHAAQGHCLLKGVLHRELNNEPRAGATNSLDHTQWACFDLDNIKGIQNVDAFVFQILPKQFHDVDYILQYSASAGVTSDGGLRAHLFFLLDEAVSPEVLKRFVTQLNFEREELCSQLELSVNGMSLRYPLDRTVNQNDKLIYIAPPILAADIVDKLGNERIQLIKRSARYVSYDWSLVKPQAELDALSLKKVAELRKAVGLKKKDIRVRYLPTGAVLLANPETARVTGEKRARGFVYLNINGGDSWGYYYPEDNPRYLYNFKGEPLVSIASFLPEYWAQIQKDFTGWKGPRPFVFRNPVSNALYSGVWDPVNQIIERDGPHQITRENVPDFFAQYELPVPEPIEDWTFEFDPTNPKVIDFEAKFCNRWQPTEYMKMAQPADEIPPTISRVIDSVVGNDKECFEHFINWLACIYQTRQKMMTAWVFHGVEGTGKGILFKDILMPIFGRKHCVSKQIAAIEDRFNADLEQCLIFNLDEARIEDSTSAKRTFNKLKHLITEQWLEIRGMRTNSYQARNYTNFIFTSNDYDALAISATDRRFNVAPRQEQKISITEDDIAAIRSELLQFAGYLSAYKIDLQKAQTALNNAAKAAMREASQDTVEQMCQAIADGNLAYFMSELDDSPGTDLITWSNYQAVLKRWLETVNRPSIVKRSDIATAYTYLIAPTNGAMGKKKFGRLLSHKNLVDAVHWCPITNKSVRGYRVEWKATDEQIAEWKQALSTSKQPTSQDASVQAWTQSLSKLI